MLGPIEFIGFTMICFLLYSFIDTFLWFNSDKDYSHYEMGDPIPFLLKWGLPISFILAILYFISMFLP